MEFLKEKNVQRLRDIRRMQCGRQLWNWKVECGTLPCRHSRIVPVKGHDEYYKGGTARVFALCAEKEKAFCTEGVSFILRRNT